MKEEVSKYIRGKMLSKQSTEDIVEEIAVKFAEWKDSKDKSWKELARQAFMDDTYSMKAAYKFWINNVYKP